MSSPPGKECLAPRVLLGERPQAVVLPLLLAVPARPGKVEGVEIRHTAAVEGVLADKSGWLSGVCLFELVISP